MEISIARLGSSRLDDFLSFFARDAFMDNPEWASCYCLFYHIAGPDWETRTAAQNRQAAVELIRSGAMSGYLAYEGLRPVGWCNANRKERFARLQADSELLESAGQKVLSVVCFVIAPGYRRKGIARRLLSQACSDAAAEGCDFVEGYPRKDAKTSAQHYHGPFALYEELGFSIHRDFPDRWIMRKAVSP